MLRAIGFLGFIFLYIPLILLMAYSFNAGDRASLWVGFSTKWYFVLFENKELLKAAGISMRVAFFSATIATFLGVIAAFVLTRNKRFRGKVLIDGMVTSPLVMPEIITGFSMLILFISMQKFIGWPANRGMTTIILAHSTFCMAYVTVIIRSRLVDMDSSLEEAAQDLGAHPIFVFFQVTLPVISPAIVAGWLLAFTLSLDDAVIVQFTSGAGSTTLPAKIYSQVRQGVTPEYNALATLIIVIVGIAIITAMQIMNRTQRMHHV